MARLSYGGDIFSPIESDASLNVSSFREGSSKRGSISEDLRVSSAKSSKNINSTNSVEVPKHHKNNNRALPLKEVALQRNEKARSKSSKGNKETMSIQPCVKGENIDSEQPLMQFRKSKRILKNKDEIAKKQTDSKNLNSSNKSSSSRTSKKKENDSILKFITVRDGESKTKDVENCTKSPLVTVSPPQTEELDGKEEKTDSFKNFNEVTVKENSSYETNPKVATVESCLPQPSNQKVTTVELSLPQPSNDYHFSPVKGICKLDLKSSSDGDDSESKKNLQNTFSSVGANLPNDPAKIQTRMMIEKLSDSVTAEFDRLRQEMYMQQICLLKALNETREEFENKYSRDTKQLYGIIDALLEENRQLRTAILARR